MLIRFISRLTSHVSRSDAASTSLDLYLPIYDHFFVRAVGHSDGLRFLVILMILKSLMMRFANCFHIKKICFAGLIWLNKELLTKVCLQEFVGLNTASA